MLGAGIVAKGCAVKLYFFQEKVAGIVDLQNHGFVVSIGVGIYTNKLVVGTYGRWSTSVVGLRR